MRIIPVKAPTWQTSDWQNELAQAVRDPAQLIAMLDLPHSLLAAAHEASRQFRLRVPHSYVARMRKGDLNDPLLRQVLPVAQELELSPGFVNDPVGDLDAMPTPGILHKYHGRALAIATGACAIHCRYCFRRHFPYDEGQAQGSAWPALSAYLAENPDVEEIILSGGDPLSLSDQRLSQFITRLNTIGSLRRLRIHSRLPIVLPSRITDELIATLREQRLSPVMVVHANHANEIDTDVRAALTRLREAGITLLNQSVLLRGVNDSALALRDLSNALFDAGVLPYYLHLLDRVQGAAHFDVPADEARAILTQLRRSLPGYLVPKLVREQAGAPSKLPAEYPPEQFQIP